MPLAPPAVGLSLRPATQADVAALGALKGALALQPPSTANTEDQAGARGFLLGSSAETYAVYVAAGAVLLAEAGGRLVAYSVVLPDELLRSSEVYEKRHQAGIAPELLARLERSRVAYFDQLAALPGHGVLAVRLAYEHLLLAMETHHAVLATTVVEPMRNVSAVPLLLGVGFVPVGEVDEPYPEVGRIRSCVYAVTREAVEAVRRSPRGARYEHRLARSLPRLRQVK